MNSLRLPFFTEINRAENVLIAGAGGGFDVFNGLPLACVWRSPVPAGTTSHPA